LQYLSGFPCFYAFLGRSFPPSPALLRVAAGAEQRCHHPPKKTTWRLRVLLPGAHICARCGRDEGPGLGAQSLPSGSSSLEGSLSLLGFIFVLQINFGLARSPAVPTPSQLGVRRAGKGRRAPCKPRAHLEGV